MNAVAVSAVALAFASVSLAQTTTHSPAECGRCGWRPPSSVRTVVVSSSGELERAIRSARPGDEILLADGRYNLERTIEIGVPNITVRGRNGDPARVILQGRGLTGDPVGVAVGVGAADVTIADVTIRAVGYHAVQVRGERGASRFTLHDAVLEDTGQQLLKGSVGTNGQHAADGLVACSVFRYTNNAPSDYTNGVDILGTRRWLIRDNRFFRIRGPAHAAGPAILAWQAAEDTVVERNLIVDSFRGIALGLRDRHGRVAYDHLRGIVRHNVVMNLNPWADEGIEVNGARSARIYHNTVLGQGQVDWSISARFPTASAEIQNNLTSKPVLSRDGGILVSNGGNIDGATAAWFANAPGLDFHLSNVGARAIDAGVAIADMVDDFDRRPRVVGKAPDAGALEAGSSR